MIDKAYLYDLVSIEQNRIHNRDNLINIGFYEPLDIKKVIDDDLALSQKGLTANPQQTQNTKLTDEGKLLSGILKKY